MQPTTALAAQPETLAVLIRQPAYADRFKEVLGDRAGQFVSSVLSVGATMKDVEPRSIISSAMIAASLDLPVNKNLGFAWIVPYMEKGVKRAQFQMGYKGFIQLALRTGQYSRMNARPVNAEAFQGYDEIGEPIIDWSKLDETKEEVGYVFAWKLTNGFTKVCYWTVEKVEAHAMRYSQAYRKGYDTPWKTHKRDMSIKTVVKIELSRWGVLSIQFQNAVDADQGVETGDEIAYPDNEPPKGTKPPLESKPIDVEVERGEATAGPGVAEPPPKPEPPKPKEKPTDPPSPPKPPKQAPPTAPPESKVEKTGEPGSLFEHTGEQAPSDDGDLPPQTPGSTMTMTAQQALMQFLDASGVSWEGFRRWLTDSGRFAADSFATIDELPADFCMKLGNDATALGKCVRLWSTKQEAAKA